MGEAEGAGVGEAAGDGDCAGASVPASAGMAGTINAAVPVAVIRNFAKFFMFCVIAVRRL